MSYLKSCRISNGKRKQTKLYTAWKSMRFRCINQNNRSYKYYGGRGISICDEWQLFDNFRNWAIKNGIRGGLTIDRINNDGNYERGNCRWATRAIQTENSSRPIIIEFNGLRLNKTQWAKRLGLNNNSLQHRLKTWTLEDALTRPKQARYLAGEKM